MKQTGAVCETFYQLVGPAAYTWFQANVAPQVSAATRCIEIELSYPSQQVYIAHYQELYPDDDNPWIPPMRLCYIELKRYAFPARWIIGYGAGIDTIVIAKDKTCRSDVI